MNDVPTHHPGAGRFAPSPSGDLHLGNLRTALLAWLFARSSGRRFLLRIDDLDRARAGSRERQVADLGSLGLDWDGIVAQSDRTDLYTAAVENLVARDLVYECYCTRREIQQAPAAPHAPQGAYPGTCRELTTAQRRAHLAAGRPPALRLRADTENRTVADLMHGSYTGVVDDLVLRRNDGVPAYNLTVVVDDHEQGIDQVVRGDDLLSSTPRQAYLADLLGLPEFAYAHVPLVLNADGKRLAKRDGAVTLSDQRALGRSPDDVLALLTDSLGFGPVRAPTAALAQFDPARLSREPWIAVNI